MLRAILVAGLMLCAGLVRAAEPVRLEVIVFPGGFNWPIWAAQETGAFAREGLDVHLTPTPGSVFQLTGVIDGKFDIAVTAIDNIIAYDVGQGEAKTQNKPDLVAIMGGDNGFLHLVTVPEVTALQQLRGKTLSVDARTTGFAFVLLKLLQQAGLSEADYKLVRAGGVLQRFEALLKHEHDGTMLISPFEIAAEARGFHDLGAAIDQFGHYQGLVSAVRREWIETHPDALVGYIRGYLAGLDWLFDPANKQEALALLRRNIPSMTPELAERSYAVLLDPKTGFARHAELDLPGVDTVLSLRREYGEPRVPLPGASSFYDLGLYQRALSSQ